MSICSILYELVRVWWLEVKRSKLRSLLHLQLESNMIEQIQHCKILIL